MKLRIPAKFNSNSNSHLKMVLITSFAVKRRIYAEQNFTISFVCSRQNFIDFLYFLSFFYRNTKIQNTKLV